VKLVMAISAPAVPGSAEAVRQANRGGDVNVIGLSLPNINKPYVHGGVVQAVILWNTRDLGYLTVLSAAKLVQNAFSSVRVRLMPAVSARSKCAGRRSCSARRC
jgi:ABC-type sugar transport system substrate-binding protein